jgi:cellobiose-specific phosphotransferase system component IIB
MHLGYALIVLILLSSGCSSSKQMARNMTEVARTAQSSKERFDMISNEALKTEHIDVLLIGDQAKAGSKEQERIIDIMHDTVELLPDIQDAVPWWVPILEYGLLSLALIGTFALLWYLGLGKPIRAFMRLFASLIPSGKRDAAKLMIEAQDPNSKTSVEEAVAVLRATDKDFDAAYRKEKK